MAWLHRCWELINQGLPLQPDPFYTRNDVLTPEVIKQVLDGMENIFVTEIARYPGYHRTHQGIADTEYLVPPGFNELPAAQQLAVVQGIDRVFNAHRMTEDELAAERVAIKKAVAGVEPSVEPSFNFFIEEY